MTNRNRSRPKIVPADVGRRIRDARQKSGMTQIDLSEACNLTQPSLSSIERGATGTPGSDTILKIAEALQTSPYYLMWGDSGSNLMDQSASNLIAIWNRLDDAGRARVLAYAQGTVDAI